MPITIPPLSRRQFLTGALAAGGGLLLERRLRAEAAKGDPHRFALMADTHVAGDKGKVVRGVHLYEHLRRAAAEISALERLPQAAMINGDCALTAGESADYRVLAELLVPMRETGVPVHVLLGNHDHREHFWTEIPYLAAGERPIENRHVGVIEAERANWFLLDSLQRTNATPGTLGEHQRKWLDAALEKRKDKPALVMAHHNPDVRERITGLTDTAALFEVLHAHPQVKAYFFGHTHHWEVRRDEAGIYLVNLPPVAYVFREGRPSGWVDMQLTPSGAALQLNCLDKNHPQHGQEVELTWRS